MHNFSFRAPNKQEEDRKKLCLEKLTQLRQRLLLQWPFIGSVIMRMDITPVRDDRLDTACTDGNTIFVDINFFSKLTDSEALFVLAHEIWHSVLLHFARLQDRKRERFNYAADVEIHFILQDEKMSEPFVLPHYGPWINHSAEEIYEQLPDFQKWLAKHPPKDTEKNSKNFEHQPKSFDTHIYKGDKLPTQDSIASGSDGQDDVALPNQVAERNDFVIDQDFSPCITDESVERARSRSIAAAQQWERTHGTLPYHIQRVINQLTTPKIPWQDVLAQYLDSCYGGDEYNWSRPNRRFVWQDIYLPSLYATKLRAVLALDTSGSTINALPTFFSELVALMRNFSLFDLDIIQCDAEIHEVEHYDEYDLPDEDKIWEAKGGGGTDFSPVFDYIENEMDAPPNVLLFFTDGDGTTPEDPPPYPVIWILTKFGEKPTDWGEVVELDD